MYISFDKQYYMYLTVLLLELVKRNEVFIKKNFLMPLGYSSLAPMGPTYHWDNLTFPTANDFCHKAWQWILNTCRWKKKYFHVALAPPPPSPFGLPQEQSSIILILYFFFKKESTYNIIWHNLTVPLLDLEKMIFEIYSTYIQFWPLGALSLGPHGGHVYHFWKLWIPYP